MHGSHCPRISYMQPSSWVFRFVHHTRWCDTFIKRSRFCPLNCCQFYDKLRNEPGIASYGRLGLAFHGLMMRNIVLAVLLYFASPATAFFKVCIQFSLHQLWHVRTWCAIGSEVIGEILADTVRLRGLHYSPPAENHCVYFGTSFVPLYIAGGILQWEKFACVGKRDAFARRVGRRRD
jgi:hypothetical protein